MNRYDYQFAVTCPSDDATVIYHLTLKMADVTQVEDILSACTFKSPQYHEAIADELIFQLGGTQTIRATHQGVHITTKRKAPAHE